MTEPPLTAAALARLLLQTLPEAQLATCDGDQPRVRPVSVVRVDGPLLYIASFRHWGKIGEVAANPKAEVSFCDPRGRHLRLTGRIRLREDPPLKAHIWQECAMMQRFFPDPADDRYALLEFQAERVRVKDAWELEYREIQPIELTPPVACD